MPAVLMCCLGNICRSPMAEAVFKHVVQQRGLDITVGSCGSANYHAGEEPDERTVETCRQHGVPIDSQARQLSRSDFDKFDYILGMDEQNVRNIEKIKPAGSKATVALFGSFGDGKPIVDPYYGKDSGFEKCYQQCVSYSEGLLQEMGYGSTGTDGKL